MCPGVGADLEPVSLAERILDGSLVFDVLYRLKLGTAESSEVGWIAEPCRRITRRYVIADLAQIVLSEHRVAVCRQHGEAELVTNLVGSDIGVAVGWYGAQVLAVVVHSQLEMGVCRVGGVYDVDQEGVTAE